MLYTTDLEKYEIETQVGSPSSLAAGACTGNIYWHGPVPVLAPGEKMATAFGCCGAEPFSIGRKPPIVHLRSQYSQTAACSELDTAFEAGNQAQLQATCVFSLRAAVAIWII